VQASLDPLQQYILPHAPGVLSTHRIALFPSLLRQYLYVVKAAGLGCPNDVAVALLSFLRKDSRGYRRN